MYHFFVLERKVQNYNTRRWLRCSYCAYSKRFLRQQAIGARAGEVNMYFGSSLGLAEMGGLHSPELIWLMRMYY